MTFRDDTLAKNIALIQDKYSFPGLITECKSALINLGLTSESPEIYTKQQWKKIIKKTILEENRRQLLDAMKDYKKINVEEIKKEESGLKEYMRTLTPHQARTKFALRTQQLRTVRMNQMSNPQFARLSWRCPHCFHDGRGLSADSQSHIVWCPSYQHLREGKNLQSDKDLVTYFQSVLMLRDALDRKC